MYSDFKKIAPKANLFKRSGVILDKLQKIEVKIISGIVQINEENNDVIQQIKQ